MTIKLKYNKERFILFAILALCIFSCLTIGKDSLISAMTLIRKDIPEKSLVAGIPGKVLKDNACWSREYIHDYEKQFWE